MKDIAILSNYKKTKGNHILSTILLTAILGALGWGFLKYGVSVSESVRYSLSLCADVLIPSTFCFMVFTSFISCTKYGELFSFLVRPLIKMMKLPRCTGSAVLMSFLGGYPVGTKAVSDLYRRNMIDEECCRRMLLFCCCPAPSYVILSIGAGLLHNLKLGILIYASLVLSALVLGILSGLISDVSAGIKGKDSSYKNQKDCQYLSVGEGIVDSVTFTSQAMLPLCGSVVLFSALVSLLYETPLPDAIIVLLNAMAEITSGCEKLAVFPGFCSAEVFTFFLAFGGLSVHIQRKQISGNIPDSGKSLMVGRIFHGILSALAVKLFLFLFPQSISAFGPDATPLCTMTVDTPIITLCIMGMCSILLLSPHRSVL